MGTRLAVAIMLSLAVGSTWCQQVDNGVATVAAVGEPGAYTGFSLSAGGNEVALVSFGSNEAIIARQANVTGGVLRFTGLACAPTPSLGPGSFVTVRLLPGDAYPEVRFELDLTAFDPEAWEGKWGKVPFHFLVCSVPGAQIFHQRGWAIGTPAIDDYIQMRAEGPGRTIVSNWSRDWTYTPPIGAYPTAVAGLWNPSARTYVGYDFHGARLTDHTEKQFGTAYCWRNGASREFFCLSFPYGKGYIDLRYPEAPVNCGTWFRLLWSRDMGPDDDPNRFVQEFLWKTYADLLPGVERMNDLSWLPDTFRISDFPPPGGLGSFVYKTGEDGDRWWEPNVNIAGGVGYFSPVDYYYDQNDRANIERLASESRKLISVGKWMDVEGERCFAWQTPLDGGGAAMFGPGVETVRHVNNWSSGLALLDWCRNDPAESAEALPYVDGVLRWTRHTLYTRNCYPDVPAAQFAWSATPCVTFCLKYYYHFRGDPERQELAQLAYKLARSMTYRYLAIWPCDNDEMDDLDSSFLMEPNAGLPWLGCACANEIWVYNIAMLYEYLSTGDPTMGQYLRGMLERYHVMFQDQWYPSVRDYGVSFTERYGLFDECAQGRGQRGSFGGLWGGFERLIWPLGSAKVRVTCGEKAAMAFNRDGRHTDISEYRYYGEGNCSFKLVPGGLQADAEGGLDVSVSFPFFRLRGKTVGVARDGQTQVLGEDRVVQYAAEPSTITLRGLKLGDTVRIGSVPAAGDVPPLPCGVVKPRALPDEQMDFVEQAGFSMLNLARGAFEGISRDWTDPKSMAGYEPGIKTVFGVPFLLLDPELTGNNVKVPRQGIALGARPEYVFLLVGDRADRSRVVLYREGGARGRVDMSGAVPAFTGWPPLYEWRLDLVMVPNDGHLIQSVAPVNCDIYAITLTDKTPDQMQETIAALKTRHDAMLAHEQAVREVAKLAPLFQSFSGHIGVLPVPGAGNPRSFPLVKMLTEAGLSKHLRFLSAADLVNPNVFSSRSIWIALYLGAEEYYQSVATEGDADAAMARWLRGGGTLVCLASGPFPFYYNENSKPVVTAPRFGLPIAGSGAGGRLDTLDVAPIHGWEKPPEGLQLSFHRNPKQDILVSVPDSFPWSTEADPRWRPVYDVIGPGNVYTPLVTLQDQDGRKYGEAAAMMEYTSGDLAGARVVYVWHSLRHDPQLDRSITLDLLAYLLKHTQPAPAEYTCIRTTTPPAVDGDLDDAVWHLAPPTEAFTRFDPDAGDAPALRTTARMAWDEENLYIAWECDDPDVWSPGTGRDSDLWEGEVVEVYADPDGDGKDYAEIEVSPLNEVVDLLIPVVVDGVPQGLEEARKWDAEGLQTAVKVQGTLADRDDRDTGWTAEAAIPLACLKGAQHTPPQVGDVWRVQLLRIDRSKSLPHPQFLSWSATNTFHNPARFGRVLFSASAGSDDFSLYPEGSAPTPTWALTGGDWKVLSGELVGADSGTDGFTPTGAVGGDSTWRDYRLSLRFQIRQRGSDHRDGAWIGFRYTDPGECYSLNLQNGATLNKALRGRSSSDAGQMARADWTPDSDWHTLAITVRGPRIVVEMDGKPLMDATDDRYLDLPPIEAGGVCLSARRWTDSRGDTVVAFDDVRMEPLP